MGEETVMTPPTARDAAIEEMAREFYYSWHAHKPREGKTVPWEKLPDRLKPFWVEMAEVANAASEKAAAEMLGRIVGMLKEEVSNHVNERWSYDYSTGQYETRNRASEEWVHDREELIERLEAIPLTPPSPEKTND